MQAQAHMPQVCAPKEAPLQLQAVQRKQQQRLRGGHAQRGERRSGEQQRRERHECSALCAQNRCRSRHCGKARDTSGPKHARRASDAIHAHEQRIRS